MHLKLFNMYLKLHNMYLKLLFLFLLFECIKCDVRGNRVRRIVGGTRAAPPPTDSPIVFTRFSGRTAKVQGTKQQGLYSFRGIPYAEPPIGTKRFVRPKELLLEGEIDATKFPLPCVQAVPGQNRIIGSEDCLKLNIFTPELPSGAEGLPVVIWIHGGGFKYGSASQYGVQHLVEKRLVVVAIQYRLGSLGFLSSGSRDLPGNAALWDMALATQWVRNYIGFFGGNPYRIVVMGHGSGASSALLYALSNIAKGITGVVAMSGTAVSPWAIDNNPKNLALQIAEDNGCPTTGVVIMFKCLQNLKAEYIIKGDNKIEFNRLEQSGFMSGVSNRLGAAPVNEGFYDGRSLPPLVRDEPVNDLFNEKFPKIPLLTGVTKHETQKAVNGKYKKELSNKLKLPNFLDQLVVKDFVGFITKPHVKDNKTQTGLPTSIFGALGAGALNFKNYLKTQTSDIHEGLTKISEAANDAIFNVPAFLTAGLWSKKGAPTYLYSFEHFGKLKKGHNFLKGLPLAGTSETDNLNDTIGHGDDLAYIFDVLDMEGQPLDAENNVMDKDDMQVREVFTQMIADFARNGKITINKKEAPPFTAMNNNFIQIMPNPKLSTNFKFCEMALWCNIAERLKSQSCQFLKAFENTVNFIKDEVVNSLNSTVNKLGIDTLIPGLHNQDLNKNFYSMVPVKQTEQPNRKNVFESLIPHKNNNNNGLPFLG